MMEIKVGTYVVKEPRTERRCPSYYAADWEELELHPGEYDLFLQFKPGYTIPMPDVLIARVSAHRVAGKVYSGICGNNFASRDLKVGEELTHVFRIYPYMLKDHANVRLSVEMEPWFPNTMDYVQQNNVTWESLKSLGGVWA
jgi:hypothetical protein